MEAARNLFTGRIHLILFCFFCWSGVIVYKLVDWQVVRKEELTAQTADLHYNLEEVPARRGVIRDRRGKILAIDCEEPFIFGDPVQINENGDPVKVVEALAKVLGKERDRRWKKEKLRHLSGNKRFCYVARRVDTNICKRVLDLGIKGIHVGSEVWRKYPKSFTGSHILGFVNSDRSLKEGIEWAYDREMSGRPGRREVLRDGKRRRIGLGGAVIREPEMGADLELTIDANIQFFVENALRRAMSQYKPRNISAIVIDTQSGAIRAMANAPDFDPNDFGDYSGFRRKNRAVVDVYEPASAFKIVTIAAGLDTGLIDLDDVVFCENGGVEVFGQYIRDHKSFGNLTMREVLWHSSNVGSIKAGRRLHPKTFHDYIRAFGFGSKTGIDLPAESAGILAPVEQWEKVSPAYLSIGHEISVTPLQMLMAASVIANKGMLIKPYIAQRIVHQDGRVVELAPHDPPVRVLKERTAAMMVEALRGVVEHGTAKEARIPEVGVFGKTGTAQRIYRGSYSRDKFNASFVGFFPVDQPRHGIIVVVHDPKGKVHGGEVAAPIFAEIGKQIVLYENAGTSPNHLTFAKGTPNWTPFGRIPNTNTEEMPDFTGMRLRNLIYQSQLLGIKLRIDGSGRVVGQSPDPGNPIPESRICKVLLKEG